MKENLATLIRYSVLFAGGILVERGVFDPTQLETIAGAGAAVGTAVYYYVLKPLFKRDA